MLLAETVRKLGLRAAAEIKQRRRALKHIRLGSSHMGDVARAPLVLNHHWK
ncbi:hypothetical protein [Streptomyces sp. NPDC059161]|uniref:hypothetical protein n=1 Tax=unclassified Streptomyces TaxID=2593676 RepID=UPI003660F6FF